MKRTSLLSLFLTLTLICFAQSNKTQVDFKYAFGEPHRLTVCMPNASNKTILDASTDLFRMSWTYHDCTEIPLGALVTFGLPWKVSFKAQVDTTFIKANRWNRENDWIPAFNYLWQGNGVDVETRIIATEKGDVLLFTAKNNDSKPHKVRIEANAWSNMPVNRRWQDYQYPYNVITPISGDRSDRILLFDSQPATGIPSDRSHIDIIFNLTPGSTDSHYLVRPYKAFMDDLQQLLAVDWKTEAEKGLQSWRELIGRAPQFTLPDYKIYNAFRACLSDIFVMREKQADGKMAGLDGTDVYRSSNSFEPNFQAMAICRLGYYKEAKENIEFTLQFQDKDGDWNDSHQWNRFMWATSGYKSYFIQQYYLQTHDKEFLKTHFPQMLASSRWSLKQRERTKAENKVESPEWGLLPRGMGDCGLMNDKDYFGVFYPHNFIHCMGLEANAWAAKELGRNDVYKELYDNYQDLYNCIQKSLKVGIIQEPNGTQWIPGTPNKTSGSRWGVAEAIYPTHIISKDSPLAIGTMKRLQKDMSKNGLPMNLGWMKGGLWMAIALDNIAYVDMLQGNADQAANYLYAVINHGTPLYSWCEERMPEAGTTKTSGDRQHAWTPICVTRFVRDMLVMEDEEQGCLWLTRAVPRWWYSVGEKIAVSDMPTQYGIISYTIERTSAKQLQYYITLKNYDRSHPIKLQLRLPDKKDKCITIVPNNDNIGGKIRL